MKLKGRFKVKIFDKTGRLKDKFDLHNGIVDVGKDKILDVMFGAVAKPTDWYIGLLDGASPTLSDADTMASHAGWSENQNYSEAVRQTWDEAAASGEEMVSNSEATFSIDTDTQTIGGLFIVDDSTKGGAGGTLWSTGLFDSAKNLDDGDTLKVEYEISVS